MAADNPSRYTDRQVVGIARHVTWVGFGVNAVLAALKILAGITGRSSAMIADGIHSLTDFITDLIVIVMIGVSRWKASKIYQYGYGKYETFATLLIGVALGFVAIALFWDGLKSVLDALNGNEPPQPRMLVLWMALLSVASKECLFHYTRRWGQRIGSTAVIANAWHHRSDAISSVATMVGVAGAIFFGSEWRILDPVAAMVVSIFIAVSSVDIARPAVRELLEVSLPPDVTEPLRTTIKDTPGVITYHHFRSRRNGPRIIIDVHIKVNPDISVQEGHAISSEVEKQLKKGFGPYMITNIHIEPYRNQPIFPDGSCED
ncbi:MAG: cation diffusion facilitator family transporter [Paramuribaculum sp.]|nr:cation diffusion facilitator family transporter [Paramuribaculum sp.]